MPPRPSAALASALRQGSSAFRVSRICAVNPLPLPLRATPVIPQRRQLSTSSPRLEKPSVALIAALRKERPVPISVAREALEKSGNDIHRAIDFLDSSSAHASKKAEKVGGRSTNEGVIAISLLGGKRVGMVQVGCETDFVARNDVFLRTARSIAGTVAFLDVPNAPPDPPNGTADPILEFPVAALLSAPLITLPPEGETAGDIPIPTTDVSTVSQTLLSSLGQTGENLKLLRATSFAAPFPSSPLIRFVPGAYVHGGGGTEGKVGGIAVLSVESADDVPMAGKIHGPGGDELEKALLDLARTVARQVVGFPTQAIRRRESTLGDEEVLLEQPAMMFGQDVLVKDVLLGWGAEKGVKVDVVGIRRWAVGEPIPGVNDEPSGDETPATPPSA